VAGFGGTLSTVALDVIGSQLQRGHIESFLRNPVAVRVNVEERMPRLGITPDEARVLAEHLSSVFRDDALEAAVPSGASELARGKTLYEDLGCRGCHIIGGQGGYVGPDLSAAGSRLRPGWVVAFLLDPERWKRATLQPDYALARDEAEALAAYVTSLRGNTP
jgi:mono/diheme cytochrome c family protein